MRKYPPIYATMRKTTKDYNNVNFGVSLEKGTYVVIPIYAIHHDPDHYANPETFDPDRFSKNSRSSHNPHAFLPFGGGPRICIASRFGLMQARIGLTMLVKKFTFERCPELIEPIELSHIQPFLSLKNPLWIKVTPI